MAKQAVGILITWAWLVVLSVTDEYLQEWHATPPAHMEEEHIQTFDFAQ